MVQGGEIRMTDVQRVLQRNWWILPITTVFCGAIGLIAALVLPKQFTSQTMVLVEQPTVPADYVKPVITEDLNHRLASMQEQILSRTRLQPIIEKFGLYANDRGRVHIDDLVDRLRTAITIKPLESMPGTQDRQLPGFYINVTIDNGLLAQQICTEITSMFLEQNARERERQATRTTTFLSEQLDEAKKKLDQQDANLADFKRKYLGSLPDEEQTNLNILMGMNTQLEASTQALSRAQQDKVFDESLLGQQIVNWKAAQTGQLPETGEQQIAVLRDQLASLLARYTPEHPDVIKLKNQIDEMQRRLTEAPKTTESADGSAPTVAGSEPPQLQQLRAKLHQDEMNITDLTRQQRQLQDQIRQTQGRVQASPVVEQKYKELTRNYQTALELYNELMKKRESSAMATDLEHQQESEQFRVYDPPSLPDKPSFPKKAYFAGGGLGGGLALGLGILYLIALSDKSLHTERDVELALKLPVLALVPTLDLGASNAQRRASLVETTQATVAPRT